MVQGTTSDAGKSILVAAIARILVKHGMRVAPFKPQNMALNSAVTADGGEIGRAQAVQAMACGLAPHVDMNPVLLKPNSDKGAQVILLGKAIGHLEAWRFNDKKAELFEHVLAAHQRLSKQYDAIIVEGAGSPAEVNLRAGDIANMGFAEAVDCPVVIVTDIHRGGAYAHLLGTYMCLSDSEKKRVKGFIINQFRGDESLLAPANEWLYKKTGVPILAVIPFIPNLYIEAEDAVATAQNTTGSNNLRVAVITYPRISNHTDFDVLRLHPNVELVFAKTPHDIAACDLVILPGSKNVQSDLAWLRQQHFESALEKHLRYGGKLFGICGGYQMLGQTISDPHGVEGDAGSSSNGLGWLAIDTQLQAHKTLRNVEGICLTTQSDIKGYEIHAGTSQGPDCDKPLFKMRASTLKEAQKEGAQSADDCVKGTYLHGVLDNTDFLNDLLEWAGFSVESDFDIAAYRNAQLDYLAEEVERAWSVDRITALLNC